MNNKCSYNNFNIDSGVWFCIWRLDNPYCEYKPELSLKYINESSDHWHSDREVDIDISVKQAKDMVKFLQSFIDEVEKDNA